MRPNLFEYWWQNESALVERRAIVAAALREARHLSRPVTVTDASRNRG